MTHKLITLKDVYKDYFKIGVAVNPTTLRQDGELIRTQFNSITAENHMKPEELQPEEGIFTFEKADMIADFAKENDLALRGHTLLWHNQTPDWFFKDGDHVASRELALERMKTHITAVLGRYTDGFYAWDVVNEVIEDKGTTILRESNWTKVVGDDFIQKAFEYAREASPNMRLFINDYNESHPEKREKYYSLIKDLIAKGTPINGVGLQAHWGVEGPAIDNIREAIEKYATLGLTLQITEMDVSMFNFDDRRTDLMQPTEQMLALQAERYEQFFDVFREYSKHIDSVTLWAASDRYNWLNDFPVRGRKNWPMLFDENNQPKESFNRIVHF